MRARMLVLVAMVGCGNKSTRSTARDVEIIGLPQCPQDKGRNLLSRGLAIEIVQADSTYRVYTVGDDRSQVMHPLFQERTKTPPFKIRFGVCSHVNAAGANPYVCGPPEHIRYYAEQRHHLAASGSTRIAFAMPPSVEQLACWTGAAKVTE